MLLSRCWYALSRLIVIGVFLEDSMICLKILKKLCCDYLLLPTVDCKQEWALLQNSLLDVVTKLGESIGVETKLYSLQAR